MKSYEIIYLLKPNAGQEAVKTSIDNISKWIKKTKGQVITVDEWGVRELGTVFKDLKQAYYVYIQFDGPPATVKELQDRIRVTEDIVRHMIIDRASILNRNPQEEELEEA